MLGTDDHCNHHNSNSTGMCDPNMAQKISRINLKVKAYMDVYFLTNIHNPRAIRQRIGHEGNEGNHPEVLVVITHC